MTGMFCAKGASTKCASIARAPGQKAVEPHGANGDHHPQPDRPPHRIAPADPIGEAEHPLGRDAEGGGLVGGGGHGGELRAGSVTFCAIHARAVSALVIVSMVVKVLDATITSVVAGSSRSSVSPICAPSTFDT